MTILEILNGSKKVIIDNINILAQKYTEVTGRKVCTSCPSDVNYMVLTLKNFYKMTNFRFIKEHVQYKDKLGDKVTISNDSMTDEKAIRFLQTNPKRIRLFSVFPENWEVLVQEYDEEKKEKKLVISAELQTIEEKKELKTDLQKMTLKELRAKYPKLEAESKVKFIDAILAEN